MMLRTFPVFRKDLNQLGKFLIGVLVVQGVLMAAVPTIVSMGWSVLVEGDFLSFDWTSGSLRSK